MMSNYLPTDYQTFIATSRYARWLEDDGRRETWGETVERYIQNIVCNPDLGSIPNKIVDEIRNAILSLEVMPSMRSLMTAGKASSRDNTCMYNCSYLPVDDPKSFDEAMLILLCGTGLVSVLSVSSLLNSLMFLLFSKVKRVSSSRTARKDGLKG